ncbi:MAG: hypothetical protein P8M21_07580 [Halioglobus sp.]|nr:hypothetical protein [Halioglobus sp.]
MEKIFVIFIVAVGLATPSIAQDNSLVFYSPHVDPHYVDMAPAGLSIGDQYTRHGDVMSDPKGPVIGEYYSQASLIFLDTAAKKSARTYRHEVILQGGTIYAWDVIQTEHGEPVKPGHMHEGAIIGGTGKYAGIRGTYTIELMPSGDVIKTSYSYWLGQ